MWTEFSNFSIYSRNLYSGCWRCWSWAPQLESGAFRVRFQCAWKSTCVILRLRQARRTASKCGFIEDRPWASTHSTATSCGSLPSINIYSPSQFIRPPLQSVMFQFINSSCSPALPPFSLTSLCFVQLIHLVENWMLQENKLSFTRCLHSVIRLFLLP